MRKPSKRTNKTRYVRITEATHALLATKARSEVRAMAEVADRILREALAPSRGSDPMTT